MTVTGPIEKATHDYSANCFKGCGRVAMVIEGDARYCARCWLKAHS